MALPDNAVMPRLRFAVKGRQLQRAVRWVSSHLWLAMPFMAIPALWPLWSRGVPQSVDGLLHLFRLMLLDRHVREGAFFPRWIPELMLGHGYPVFNFYASSTYYLVEGFVLLGLNYFGAFIAAFSMLVIAAGFGMFLLARDLFGQEQQLAALVAATAYMYAPYLLTNVYMRGAIAEVGAQALLPWVLWATWRLMSRTRQPACYAGMVALALGGMVVTHTITLLFLPVLWGGFVLVSWWQNGRQPSRLVWALAATAGALGVSAFFWVPLVAERQYLSDAAYEISATLMHGHVWSWSNFLDKTFAFDYTIFFPFQLGLVQVVLAALGFFAARRRDPVWVFLVVVAVFSGLGISAWALPMWLTSDVFLIAQFPWRLLTVLSIPLAVFTGGLVVPWRRSEARIFVGLLTLALVVLANQPRLDWLGFWPKDDIANGLAAVAQLETELGALGTSSAAEFRPRWVQSDSLLPVPDEAAGVDTISVERASSYGLIAEVSGATGGPFRFSTLYFPGWQVLLADERPLRTYPSTSLGLLTVDLPPGSHRLHLTWQGTPVQRWAGAVTLLALGILVWGGLRRGVGRWQAILPAVLLAIGIAVAVCRPSLGAVKMPRAPVNGLGVRLLGYQTMQESSRYLLLHPYWYVDATPSGAFQVRWQFLDDAGRVLSESLAKPYFNAASAADWARGMLVADAYQLPIPPGLPAGAYQLAVRLEQGMDVAPKEPVVIGDVSVAASAPPEGRPTIQGTAEYGGSVLLAGYDGPLARRSGDPGATSLVVAKPGDALDYTLYWQALRPLSANYHSFVHLVDASGQPLVQSDQLAGTMFAPPKIWDTYHLQPDRFHLRIPQNAAGGLYWPSVGLYDFQTLARLPISETLSNAVVADYRLAPVKVVGSQRANPQHKTDAQFAQFGSLEGYDLALPAGGLHAGDQMTVTLYFRGKASTDGSYTRFLHLRSPSLAMAAQGDGLPQAGRNPTWAWVPEEIIADPVVLTISQGTPPGSYALSVGLYDAESGGVRVPTSDGQGRPLPDSQVVLTELEVE